MISALSECWDSQKVQCDGGGKWGLCRQRVLGCNPLTGYVTLDKSLDLFGPQFPHLYRAGVVSSPTPSSHRSASYKIK